jgi:uncharacterized membrane protein HdeD (DUF308 family)
MITRLLRNWWIPVVRGVLALIFGVLVFVEPASAIAALVLVFGAFAFADGIMAIVAAMHKDVENRGLLIFGGIVGILAGVATFFIPQATALALYSLIAAWAIVTGVAELVLAIRWRKIIPNEVWMILSGIASIAFGVALVALPMAGFIAITALIGIYAFASGIVYIALGIRLRGLATVLSPGGAHPTATPAG